MNCLDKLVRTSKVDMAAKSSKNTMKGKNKVRYSKEGGVSTRIQNTTKNVHTESIAVPQQEQRNERKQREKCALVIPCQSIVCEPADVVIWTLTLV